MPNQRAITAYETASGGIPECFDFLTGDTFREVSEDIARGANSSDQAASLAGQSIRTHFKWLDTWRDALDQLDSEIRGDDRAYLKQQARALFAAQQTLLRAVAEYHHGTAGPLLDPGYGYAYKLSNSTISPF